MAREKDKDSDQNQRDEPPRDTGWHKIEEHTPRRDWRDNDHSHENHDKPDKSNNKDD